MKYLFLFSFVLFFRDSQAVTPLELSKLVEERAPLIKIYVEQQNASESNIRQAKILGNPVLSVQGGELRSGGTKGSVLDFTVMQPLPWPGKREAGIRNQEFLNKISRLNLSEARIELAHRVYLLAYELASITEIEDHNKERRDRFALISKYLGSRPLASPKQILEKDMIFSQLRVVEKSMNEASARKRSIEKELQILTGLPEVKVDVDWKKIPKSHERAFYLSRYLDSLKFKKMKEELRINQNSIEAAKLQARPDIMVGVNYRQENTEPANHFYHGQVSLVIPIIDHGQHTVETARAGLRRNEAELKLLDQNVRTELENLFANHETAMKNIEIFPLSLRPQSEDRFRKAEEAFRKGQIDVMTFLQSDTQVHENVHLIYTSRLEYLYTISRLELLVSHHMERE